MHAAKNFKGTMGDVNSLLKQRLQQNKQENKASQLAKRSADGQLSSFSGLFRFTPINEQEKIHLENILKHYQKKQASIQKDLEELSILTSELKAISNQAILLHGERIKKAQILLKNYKEGAFTAWLTAAYGNRQTPYNFLQYFEFYTTLPRELQQKVFEMPRQAVYTLASREGEMQAKQKVIQEYNGEPKDLILEHIRKVFPLKTSDKRRQNLSGLTISTLSKLLERLKSGKFSPSEKEKTEIIDLLNHLISLTNMSNRN